MNDRRLRVALVMEATIGGTRKHLVQLARGLHRQRFVVTVVCAVLRDAELVHDLRELREQGVNVVEVPMRREVRPLADGVAVVRLWRLFRATKPDVVHTHSSKAGVLGRVAARLAGIGAIVHSPHSFAFLHDAEFSRWRRWVYLAIERVLGRRTDRLVAVSAAEGRAAVAHRVVSPERVTVIHNGIEPDLADRITPAAVPGTGPDDRVIGCVGLLEPSKGQSDLVAALVGVRDEVRALKCLLVGDGSRRDALEEQVRADGLEDVVVFVGMRDRAVELIGSFEILVLPSLWEGLPYVILEAMALGRPVVATDVGGCPELVVDGETGLIVPPCDPPALADALRRLLEDPERVAAMGHRGRERAQSRFPLAKMIASHSELYQELLPEAS